MACYHPLKAAWYGELTEKGKKKYILENPEYEYISPIETIEIPCGKCIGCRIDYSKEWATRCMLEAKNYKYNAFITLTYNEENVRHTEGINIETGETVDRLTLHPEDITKFMKDLRRYWKYHYNEDNIKFYLCGEYGETTGRPHYHIIAFNLHIRDLEPFFINKNKDQIYLSETINKIWKMGQTSIGEVTWQSCSYTARYVMKKLKGKDSKEIYELLGIIPEFVRMSRNPGIGRSYFEKNKAEIYQTDELFIEDGKGKVLTLKPVKYFDRLFDLDSPEAMQAIKLQRKKNAIISEKNRETKTNLTKKEYTKIKEINKIESLKKLKRTI